MTSAAVLHTVSNEPNWRPIVWRKGRKYQRRGDNERSRVGERGRRTASRQVRIADVTGLVEGNKDWSHATRLVEQTNVHGHSLALQPTIASAFLHPPHIPMHDSRDLETEVIRSF